MNHSTKELFCLAKLYLNSISIPKVLLDDGARRFSKLGGHQ